MIHAVGVFIAVLMAIGGSEHEAGATARLCSDAASVVLRAPPLGERRALIVELTAVTNPRKEAFVVAVDRSTARAGWTAFAWLSPFPVDEPSRYALRLAPGADSAKPPETLRFRIESARGGAPPGSICVDIRIAAL